MAAIRANGLSFGEFIVAASTKGMFSLKAAEKEGLEHAFSYAHAIAAFFRGRTNIRVATVLDLWMKHPKGLPKPNSPERGALFSLSTPWSDLGHARPTLTSWAAQACASAIERETRLVIQPEHGLHALIHTPKARNASSAADRSTVVQRASQLVRWSDLGESTIDTAQSLFRSVTPLIWGFIEQVAKKTRRASAANRAERRPSELVVTGVIGQLLYCRKRTVNVLPLQRSLTFFASRASTIIYRIESRFGSTTTYNTLIDGLRTAGNERIAAAAAIARSLVQWGKLIFDNTQRYNRQHEMRFGRENQMLKGAAGIWVQMVGFHPSAWDLNEKLRLIALGKRYTVTTANLFALIDHAHLRRVRPLHWLQALVEYIPELAHLRDNVLDYFAELAAKEALPIPGHKTTIFSLRSNGSDLSYTAGICDAVKDFLGTQLGQTKENWQRRLTIVGGDGATFEGLSRLKKQRQNHEDEFTRFDNAEHELELWHTCWTELNRFYTAHSGPVESADPSTLRASMNIIHRAVPRDLHKVEFQSSLDTLMLIGHARMLDCWRVILGTYDLRKYFSEKKRENALPTLPELLELAKRLDLMYSSPRAHDAATQPRDRQPASQRAPEDPEWTRTKSDEEIGETTGFCGDRVLANAIAFLHDFVLMREWRHATSTGHAGRVYEVLTSALFNFAGSGHNPKYTAYVLETVLSLEYECSPALKAARLQNWLINPSGLAGHYIECDLAQEHFIKPLTMYLQRANAAYDGDFERNVLSPNLDQLVALTQRMESAVHLSQRSKKHTAMHADPELRILLEFYQLHDFHRFHVGNSFGHAAPLAYAVGASVMPQKLRDYLTRHRSEADIFFRIWPHERVQPDSESPNLNKRARLPADEEPDVVSSDEYEDEDSDSSDGTQALEPSPVPPVPSGEEGTSPEAAVTNASDGDELLDGGDDSDGDSDDDDVDIGTVGLVEKYWDSGSDDDADDEDDE